MFFFFKRYTIYTAKFLCSHHAVTGRWRYGDSVLWPACDTIARYKTMYLCHLHANTVTLCIYNPRKMSWNIQASLGKNGSPHSPSAMLRRASVFSILPKYRNIKWWGGAGEGKSISWSNSFLLIPILNNLIHIKKIHVWFD